MEGHLMAWGVALGIVIDVVMIAWGCRAVARGRERSAQAGAAPVVLDPWVDDVYGAFEPSDGEDYSHGLLTNPATGWPMLDGVWVDVAGNPYGTDLADNFGSSLDGIGSTRFESWFGGLHDW